MKDHGDHRGYRPGEDVSDKVPRHADRWEDEFGTDFAEVQALREQARALWAIAWVLDELRADHIDGP